VRNLILVITFVFSFFSSHLVSKEVITLWSYYDYPPFVTGMADNKGLSFDFVEMLNLFNPDQDYQYKLEIIPRKRLDSYLKNGRKGAVLWVNPVFFADVKRQKYRWTEQLLQDEQSFISSSKTPFIFEGAESLMQPGFVLGGIRGHLYGGMQGEIDAGKIIRSDVSNVKQNIGMLLKNRVDSFLIPFTTMKFYEKEMKLGRKIYYSPNPLNSYTRHILVNHDAKVYGALSKVVNQLEQDEYWMALLMQYGLNLPLGSSTDY